MFFIGCGGNNTNSNLPYDIDPKTGKYKTLDEQNRICVLPAKRFTDEDGIEWEEDKSIKPTFGESLFGKGFSEKNYPCPIKSFKASGGVIFPKTSPDPLG